MSAEPTIAARHALVILDAAAHFGVSREQLLRAAQISAASLSGADARIPLSAQARLWSEAVRLTGDESLGVRIGGSLSPGRLGILEPIILGSATVADALERFIRLERLSADGVVTTLRFTERDAIVSHGPRTPGNICSPHGIEVTFAAVLSIARSSTGQAFVPRAVRLKRSAPRDLTEYERVFCVAPQFGAPDDALILDRASLAMPLPNSRSCTRLRPRTRRRVSHCPAAPADRRPVDHARLCMAQASTRQRCAVNARSCRCVGGQHENHAASAAPRGNDVRDAG